MTEGEAVWRALADPTRRRILELLRDQPRTTGQLCAAFPTTRFAVMKHLGVLTGAGLVVVRRRGRERWNHLDPVPLREALERFLSPHADRWASSMLRLREAAESPGGVMTELVSLPLGTLDVQNDLRIAAPPEKLFDALVRMGDWWPHRFRENSTVRFEATVGGRFWEDWGDGDGALYGTVGAIRRPEKLAVSGPMGMQGPVTSVFSYELVPDGDGTLLKGSHRAFGDIDEETRAGYTAGWTEVHAALVDHLSA